MPTTIHIKDLQYNKYLVAGDVWDGAVYHQDNRMRPNAVWALRLWKLDGVTEICRFIDLRHGCHLANQYGTDVPAQPSRRGFVANIPVYEEPLDDRAQWTRNEVAPGIYTLRNVFDGGYLCANGSNDGIRLDGNPGSRNAQWQFESALQGYFDPTKQLPPRLPITKGKINYTIDTSNAPVHISDTLLLGVFDDVVTKWIQAFNRMGVKLEAQRDGTPVDIAFCWGTVDDDDDNVGAYVPPTGATTARSSGTGRLSR